MKPSDFKPESFRRYIDDLPVGVSFILGQLKDEDRMQVQSVRFSASDWTVDRAKDWLKENEYSTADFEDAADDMSKRWQVSVPISKTSDDDERLAFGWASVIADGDGDIIIDHQEDRISIPELEKAAYEYVRVSREATEMHIKKGIAELVESVVITPEKRDAMGIDKEGISGWWVGFKVNDPDVWEKVKSGIYSEFSIGGSAKRKEIES